MYRLLIALALLCHTFAATAQDKYRTTLFGVGCANIYDTYLSPLEYSGIDISFAYTFQRRTHWQHVTTQGALRIHGSRTLNAVGNRTNWGGAAAYTHLWHCNWDWSRWTLRAGGGIEGMVGGLYNTHGGNNPAQAYARASLVASVAADCRLRLCRHDFTVRAQLDAPFLGMTMSPNRGQSYYDMFMKRHYDHNIVCAGPWNAPTLRGTFTVDIPIGRKAMCIGYMFEVEQAKPNNLRRHTYLNNFVIGWKI